MVRSKKISTAFMTIMTLTIISKEVFSESVIMLMPANGVKRNSRKGGASISRKGEALEMMSSHEFARRISLFISLRFEYMAIV